LLLHVALLFVMPNVAFSNQLAMVAGWRRHRGQWTSSNQVRVPRAYRGKSHSRASVLPTLPDPDSLWSRLQISFQCDAS
jgi:hypothetical protein